MDIKNSPDSTVLRQKRGGLFYKIVSIVLLPLFMPLFGIIFLFQINEFSFLPALFKWISYGGTVLFTIILPIIPMVILRKKGEISDLFISKREQRFIPYLFSFLAYVFWVYFLWRTLQMPMYVVALGAGSTLSIFMIMFINMKWKISAHMGGIGGFVGGVFGLCYRIGVNPVWFLVLIIFLSVLLGLARVETKAHTPAQVAAGFILGFLSVFLCCLYFQ